MCEGAGAPGVAVCFPSPLSRAYQTPCFCSGNESEAVWGLQRGATVLVLPEPVAPRWPRWGDSLLGSASVYRSCVWGPQLVSRMGEDDVADGGCLFAAQSLAGLSGCVEPRVTAQ